MSKHPSLLLLQLLLLFSPLRKQVNMQMKKNVKAKGSRSSAPFQLFSWNANAMYVLRTYYLRNGTYNYIQHPYHHSLRTWSYTHNFACTKWPRRKSDFHNKPIFHREMIDYHYYGPLLRKIIFFLCTPPSHFKKPYHHQYQHQLNVNNLAQNVGSYQMQGIKWAPKL